MFALFVILGLLGAPPQAAASDSPATLPEIGRVKALVPACATLRDLVIPSYFTMRKADVEFETIANSFDTYAEALDQTNNPAEAKLNRNLSERQMYLTRMGSNAAQMAQDLQSTAKALRDPRLSPAIDDPRIQEQREQLQKLYALQSDRLALLNEFLANEEHAANLDEIHQFMDQSGTKTPVTFVTPAPDAPDRDSLPHLTGTTLSDQDELKRWSIAVATQVLGTEHRVVASLLQTAQGCNAK